MPPLPLNCEWYFHQFNVITFLWCFRAKTTIWNKSCLILYLPDDHKHSGVSNSDGPCLSELQDFGCSMNIKIWSKHKNKNTFFDKTLHSYGILTHFSAKITQVRSFFWPNENVWACQRYWMCRIWASYVIQLYSDSFSPFVELQPQLQAKILSIFMGIFTTLKRPRVILFSQIVPAH